VKIYTKKGDQGFSTLLGGQAVMKSDLRLEAYGTLDELNSCLGVVRASMQKIGAPLFELDAELQQIQVELFTAGSHLAAGTDAARTSLPQIGDAPTKRLEAFIDKMESELPPLKNFILPGGTETSSLLHLARTIARRGERAVVRVTPVDSQILIFINRLSDFLFVAARFANLKVGVEDVLWTPRQLK
jgi:cob(I)alamin adenosyltransferase